jgi:hypothetical protein
MTNNYFETSVSDATEMFANAEDMEVSCHAVDEHGKIAVAEDFFCGVKLASALLKKLHDFAGEEVSDVGEYGDANFS